MAVTSVMTFKKLLMSELVKNRGWLMNSEFLKTCEKRLGSQFSDSDRRLLNHRPKWKNQVDFAKAVLSRSSLIMTRSKMVNGKRDTMIVLTSHLVTIQWVGAKKVYSSYKKKCPGCLDKKVPLNMEQCGKCGHVFGLPEPRVDRNVGNYS
ncbi:hypothetical protein Pla110_33190 [Polystyrenella longa]|uniref:Uncharacterized protein n=1 Tax=Polystyrenella longa TaxID=2528007 RepID=A0A518CQS2_9PLAN|nr:zinc ribbon domain-containing protein [Polystyrenella longa]QDU81577.1 hypothetical protein Pla110_33190 [Polystyrenella longa]